MVLCLNRVIVSLLRINPFLMGSINASTKHLFNTIYIEKVVTVDKCIKASLAIDRIYSLILINSSGTWERRRTSR